MGSQRHKFRERSSKRGWSWGISTQRTSSTHTKPLIDAIRVKTMSTIGDASNGIVGLVIREANGARAIVRGRKTTTLSEDQFRVGFDDGAV